MVRLRSIAFALMTMIAGAAQPVWAQVGDPDELVRQARKLSLNGDRAAAKSILEGILMRYPNHADAQILLGRIYGWDGEYDAARGQLQKVVDAYPAYVDAREAMIDIELWSGHPNDALRLAETGLEREPRNKRLLFKKAKALAAMGETREAMTANRNALRLDPGFAEAGDFSRQLESSFRPYRFRVEHTADFFDRTFDPWRLTSISLSREQRWGVLIGRANLANRFNQNAAQVEIDAYPRFGKATYGYFNLGYSPSDIFPTTRIGAELYQGLPGKFEASFGIRHLRFSDQEVTVYTGSISRYYGPYWFSLRPSITPGSQGQDLSLNMTARRYLGDGESYVSAMMGFGSAPNERNATAELIRLSSQRFGGEIRKQIRPGWFGLGTFGFERQELPLAGTRKHFTLGFGVERRF